MQVARVACTGIEQAHSVGLGEDVRAIYGLLSTAGVDGRFAHLRRERVELMQNAPLMRSMSIKARRLSTISLALLDQVNGPAVSEAPDRLSMELQAQLSTVDDLLERLDRNQDGILDRKEIRPALAEMCVSATELGSVTRAFDKDGTGNFDRTELRTVLTNMGSKNINVDDLTRAQYDDGVAQGSAALSESDLRAIDLNTMGSSDERSAAFECRATTPRRSWIASTDMYTDYRTTASDHSVGCGTNRPFSSAHSAR